MTTPVLYNGLPSVVAQETPNYLDHLVAESARHLTFSQVAFTPSVWVIHGAAPLSLLTWTAIGFFVCAIATGP